ncbi:MAG: cupin domain-containing protein [Myxococcales bacterium]|nr:cupin domain-containing protein [Myxococcales bacterium]
MTARARSRLAWVVVACAAVLSSCASQQGGSLAAPGSASPRTRVLGSGPRVLLAQVLLPPGARFTLPTSVCQEVFVYVRHGAAELDGGRVLLPGRAVRFGLEGAAVGNGSSRDTELYLVVSRSVARRFGPDATLDMQLAPSDPACGESAGAAALSELGAQPFVHAGGELRVSLLLDGPGQGTRHASLTRLDASATAGVPLHEHEESAEVIFIEQGEGRMRVGDQLVAVRPGTFVYIPPHTPHSFSPSGNSPLQAVQVYAPGGPEQRFRVTAPAPTGSDPAQAGVGAEPTPGAGSAPGSGASAGTWQVPTEGADGAAGPVGAPGAGS